MATDTGQLVVLLVVRLIFQLVVWLIVQIVFQVIFQLVLRLVRLLVGDHCHSDALVAVPQKESERFPPWLNKTEASKQPETFNLKLKT